MPALNVPVIVNVLKPKFITYDIENGSVPEPVDICNGIDKTILPIKKYIVIVWLEKLHVPKTEPIKLVFVVLPGNNSDPELAFMIDVCVVFETVTELSSFWL